MLPWKSRISSSFPAYTGLGRERGDYEQTQPDFYLIMLKFCINNKTAEAAGKQTGGRALLDCLLVFLVDLVPCITALSGIFASIATP